MLSPTIGVEKVATLAGHADAVYAVCGADADHKVISTGGDGMVAMWDLRMPDLGHLVAQIPSSSYALAFDQSRQLLALGHNHDGIHVIDWATKAKVGSLSFTKHQIFSLLIKDKTLFAATADGILHTIRWPELVLGPSWILSDKSLRKIAQHPTTDQLAIGSSDGWITVLDLKSKTIHKRWQAHQNSVFALAYSPDGKQLVSGSRDAHLKSWDSTAEYSALESVVAHNYAINAIAFSPDGQYIASVSMDKAIKIWHYPTLKLLKVIDKARHAGHGTSVNAVYWSPFNNQLVTASDDRMLSVWEINLELLRQRASL